MSKCHKIMLIELYYKRFYKQNILFEKVQLQLIAEVYYQINIDLVAIK